MQTVQGQILQHQGGTYLIQGGTMDGEGTPLTHTTRASPATVSIQKIRPWKLGIWEEINCDLSQVEILEAWYLRRNKLWLIPREIFWSGAVVDRQLWNSWRCQSSQEYPVQSLFKTLSGTEPGSNEPCFIWQTHQISVFGTSNKTLRNQASLLIA